MSGTRPLYEFRASLFSRSESDVDRLETRESAEAHAQPRSSLLGCGSGGDRASWVWTCSLLRLARCSRSRA